MGNKLILTGTTITDLTAPVLLQVDPLESAGSLALYEPAHPAGPMAAGVPVNGTAIPNLLAAKALTMIPTATAATLAGQVALGSSFTGAKGRIERTGKGGIHLITSQNAGAGIDVNTYARCESSALLGTFLNANPTHDIFYSIWARITRLSVAGTAANPLQSKMTNPTSANSINFYSRTGAGGDTEYPNTAARIGYRHSANLYPEALGPLIQNIAVDTATAWAAATATVLMHGGTGVVAGIAADYAKAHSIVFYRAYLEDLTVSGRTYAQVDALDIAEYTKQCVTAGGRYVGDTYSDPATLVP